MPPPTPFDPALLMMGRDLRLEGREPTTSPGLVRVRRGVWIESSVWAGLTPAQRHGALVHGTAASRIGDEQPVFCLWSAAALHGLPRIGAWPTGASTLATGDGRVRSSGYVGRHIGPPATPVVVRGLLATSAARTVVDIGRTEPLPGALAAADHALRHELCGRADLEAEVAQLPPSFPGRRRAVVVCALADGLAMSAGESVSRAGMYLMNLPRPRLQVPYDDDDGVIGLVDFGWEGVVGEFDGKLKYAVPDDATPQEAGRIVWREKRREDRLRRKKFRVARWVWAEAVDRRRLAPILAAVGIVPQRRNTWFEDGELPHEASAG